MSVPEWFADKTIKVIDCEMTGPDPTHDEIVEVAWVEISDGKISGPDCWYDEFFRNTVPMSNQARIITGLTDGFLAQFGTLSERLSFVHGALAQSDIGGHNVEFDRGYLNIAFVANELEPIYRPMMDTLALAHELIEERPFARPLQALADRYQLVVPNAGLLEGLKEHRAIFDAHLTAQLLCAYVEIAADAGRAKSWAEFVKLARPFDDRPDFESLALQRAHRSNWGATPGAPGRTI